MKDDGFGWGGHGWVWSCLRNGGLAIAHPLRAGSAAQWWGYPTGKPFAQVRRKGLYSMAHAWRAATP